MNIVSIQFKIKEHKMIIDGETDTGGKFNLMRTVEEVVRLWDGENERTSMHFITFTVASYEMKWSVCLKYFFD
jgi:hypothetical protein